MPLKRGLPSSLLARGSYPPGTPCAFSGSLFQRAEQAIELPDHDGVTLAQLIEQAVKLARIVQHTPRGRAWRLAALLEALPPDPRPKRGLPRSSKRMGINGRKRTEPSHHLWACSLSTLVFLSQARNLGSESLRSV